MRLGHAGQQGQSGAVDHVIAGSGGGFDRCSCDRGDTLAFDRDGAAERRGAAAVYDGRIAKMTAHPNPLASVIFRKLAGQAPL